ncbi:hypothetical protein VTK26DRAFT_169 [Humicola hyalothermophila]
MREAGEATLIAYNMCVGVSDAAARTHESIVATLVLPASGTGPLLVPTPVQTETSTIPPTQTAAVTLTSMTGTSAECAPTSTSTTSPTLTDTAASAADSDPQLHLSSAQIAGITLGCAAVLVLGVLLVLLARCVRRKRMGDLESGFFAKMRDSTSFGRRSRPSSFSAVNIPGPLPRIHAERKHWDPRLQPSLPDIRQGGLGLGLTQLGIGPAASTRTPPPAPTPIPKDTPPARPPTTAAPAAAPAPATTQNSIPRVVPNPPPEITEPRVERSPPKPTLTLTIPKSSEQVARVPASSRDSVVTEFAEDGEGDIAPGTSIWRPPPTDPQSATTYFFADKGGNWVLRNTSTRNRETIPKPPAPTKPVIHEAPATPVEVELPSPEHKTRAEKARDVRGGFTPDAVVSPLRLPRRHDQGKLGSPIAFKDQRREPTLASPDPSVRLSQTAETIAKEPGRPSRQRAPDAYFGVALEGRDLTGGKGRRRSTRRASRRVSLESATSIESAAAAPFEEEDVIEDEPQVDLSPVVESPNTPISPGKSPVAYPKIRKSPTNDRALETAARRAPDSNLLPPAHRYNVWHPPGRASPTGQAILPKPKSTTPLTAQSSGPSQRPWNAPSLNPVPMRDPARVRAGSPEVRPGSVSPIEKQYWERQRQVGNPASYWNQPHHPRPGPRRPQPQPQPPELQGEPMMSPPRRQPSAAPPQQYQQYQRQQHQRQQQQQQQQQQRGAGTGGGVPAMRPAPLPTPQQTPQPQHPAVATPPQPQNPRPGTDAFPHAQPRPQAQPPSSLLAKRRGADKAAALVLLSNGNGAGQKTTTTKKKKKAARPGWAREVADSPSSACSAAAASPVVPITPGWVPELTPTRRGEDLYLDVR